jgi:hypothetical protein
VKNRIFIFIATFISIATFGQKDIISISGKYYDQLQPTLRIEAMNVWLTLNDSLIIESLPDILGKFSFKISRNILRTHKVKLRVFQDQKLLDKIHPINDCPYLRKMPLYYNSQSIKEPAIFKGCLTHLNNPLLSYFIIKAFVWLQVKRDCSNLTFLEYHPET